MLNKGTRWRCAAIAAIAAASLALPLTSQAQPQQGAEGPHAAGVHLKKKPKQPGLVHQQPNWYAGWYMPPPTWTHFSTFPQGEPDYQYNYHGSNGR